MNCLYRYIYIFFFTFIHWKTNQQKNLWWKSFPANNWTPTISRTPTLTIFLYTEHVFIGRGWQMHRYTFSQVRGAETTSLIGLLWSASSSSSRPLLPPPPPFLRLLLVVLQVSQYPAWGTQDGHKHGCQSYCLLLRDTDTKIMLNSSYLDTYLLIWEGFYFSNAAQSHLNWSEVSRNRFKMVNTVYTHLMHSIK